MMKKILCAGMAVLLICLLSLSALAEEGATVRVSGNATVTLAADYATLQIGVTTRQESVSEAQRENAEQMQLVIAAIREAGVAEKDVTTSQFNVYSSFETTYDSKGKEIRRYQYQVENMLSVTVRDLTQVGTVLDAAMAAGANTTYGISFASSQNNEAYQKALTRAVQDAGMKAQVLCDAAGMELGALLTIDATQANYNYGVSNVYSAKNASADTAIISGDVSVSANVVLVYEMKNR